MRVLIACEYSGVVREAFRARGHDAWSCDLLPSEDDSPYHVQTDVLGLLADYKKYTDLAGEDAFDLMIAHPPCTFIANSGWHWVHRQYGRYAKAEAAADFFLQLWNQPIKSICIENPVPGPMLKRAAGKPTQYVQPYMFGDDASKKTGLWLKNLPTLSVPSEETWAQPRIVNGKKRWSNQTDSGQNKLPPSPTRGHDRSRTYEGIARAMAEQWG